METMRIPLRATRSAQRRITPAPVSLGGLGSLCAVTPDDLRHAKYPIIVLIGTAIGAVGNQLVTTVMITYSLDYHPQEAASIGVFITFVRQIWGYTGPFWFSPMFKNVGVAPSADICSALVVAVSIIPTIFLHARVKVWRRNEGEE